MDRVITAIGGNKWFALFTGLIAIPTAGILMQKFGASDGTIQTCLVTMTGLIGTFMGSQAYTDVKTGGMTSRSAKSAFLQTLRDEQTKG